MATRFGCTLELGWLAGVKLAGWLQTGIILIAGAQNTDRPVSFL